MAGKRSRERKIALTPFQCCDSALESSLAVMSTIGITRS
jgi:hypothetical protein